MGLMSPLSHLVAVTVIGYHEVRRGVGPFPSSCGSRRLPQRCP